MPDAVGLREAVQEEERWTTARMDAVDNDRGVNICLYGDIEFFEAFEHFEFGC